MPWFGWVAVAAAVLAATAVVLALANRRAIREQGTPLWHPAASARSTPPVATETADATQPLVAFVANPTKPGVAALRDAVRRECVNRHLPEPLWLETTVDDPGVGQTREAIDAGAQVVVAIGGDGTVRAVAEGLAGSCVPMGMIPQGTGNLLARNLDLPLGDTDALLRIALTGTDRRIDVGWLTVLRDESEDDAHDGGGPLRRAPDARTPDAEPADSSSADGGLPDGALPDGGLPVEGSPDPIPTCGDRPARDHIFLVIAGLGFDAAMVADADEDLKARVGWIAYFVAGIKHLHAHRMRLQVSLDDSPWYNVRLRSLLIGNCGKLPGGITLLPDAVLDDGWLDIGAIDTRVGLVGWGQLFGEVALQRFGVRSRLPNKAGKIDHARAKEMRVRARDPQQIQVDGDIIGSAYEIAARVEALALTVRVDGGV